MTPTAFKAIRERAGLTQARLAGMLRISDSRSIRRYENGDRAISGPVSLLMEQIEDANAMQRAFDGVDQDELRRIARKYIKGPA